MAGARGRGGARRSCLACDAHACDQRAIRASGRHHGHELEEQLFIEAESRKSAKAAELWTYMRQTKSDDPNWLLDDVDTAD